MGLGGRIRLNQSGWLLRCPGRLGMVHQGALMKEARKGVTMRVMGTNTWDMDVDTDFLIDQALEFSEAVKEQGIAELVAAWIEPDKRMLWCAWRTDDLSALQVAFDEMNEQSGLRSELSVVEEMYPDRGGRDEREAQLLSGIGIA